MLSRTLSSPVSMQALQIVVSPWIAYQSEPPQSLLMRDPPARGCTMCGQHAGSVEPATLTLSRLHVQCHVWRHDQLAMH